MRVEWTEPALEQWEQSLDYIEAENAAAALRIEGRVVNAIEMLGPHPYAGRIGRIAGTPQFAVPQSPFLVVYEVNQPEDILWVVAVFDGRRRRPKAFPKE